LDLIAQDDERPERERTESANKLEFEEEISGLLKQCPQTTRNDPLERRFTFGMSDPAADVRLTDVN